MTEKIEMYRHILAAADGSDLATAAVKHAAAIASAFNARLSIVTVALMGPILDSMGSEGAVPQSIFDEIRRATFDHCADVLKAAKEIAGPDADAETVESLAAYDGILDAARKRGADLIVMGSHSRSALGRLILGSQAAKVVNLSEVPVLIVKHE